MVRKINRRFYGLVVEDDPVAQAFMKDYLRELADLEVVSSGKEALAVIEKSFKQQPFDFVCLDIRLPDMAGSEVLEFLRGMEKKMNFSKSMRSVVIMTTAESSIKVVLKAMNRGCNGYVVKPFSRDRLFEELNKGGMSFEWDREPPTGLDL